MTLSAHINNPFAMLINAEAVLSAMQHSEALERLAHQVHRPLDKVAQARLPQDLAAYDEDVDATIGDDISDLPAEDRGDASGHQAGVGAAPNVEWENSAFH